MCPAVSLASPGFSRQPVTEEGLGQNQAASTTDMRLVQYRLACEWPLT